MSPLPSLAVLVCCVGLAGAQAPVRESSQLLHRLVDLDWLWQAPMRGERCVQFSSFDRASSKGPATRTRGMRTTTAATTCASSRRTARRSS
jgi:hypothetical protein